MSAPIYQYGIDLQVHTNQALVFEECNDVMIQIQWGSYMALSW